MKVIIQALCIDSQEMETQIEPIGYDYLKIVGEALSKTAFLVCVCEITVISNS